MAMMNILDNAHVVCDHEMNCVLDDDLVHDNNVDLIRDSVVTDDFKKHDDDNFSIAFAIKTDAAKDLDDHHANQNIAHIIHGNEENEDTHHGEKWFMPMHYKGPKPSSQHHKESVSSKADKKKAMAAVEAALGLGFGDEDHHSDDNSDSDHHDHHHVQHESGTGVEAVDKAIAHK